MEKKEKITISAIIAAPLDKVWKNWTEPKHITQWNHASDEWHSPHATNDLRKGGKFLARMEAKDGSMGFDFEGTYDNVVEKQLIEYTMLDGRTVSVRFAEKTGATEVIETFDPESTNSLDMQRDGWQAILDNFKKYTESTEE